MNKTGTIVSVNISEKKGTSKSPVQTARIDRYGIKKDAHRGSWQRQVTLLSVEAIEEFSKQTGRKINFGDFAENLSVAGFSLENVKIFDRFRAGKVILEVTQIGKECHGNDCAIFREVGKCIMPGQGIFTRVIQPGRIAAGCPIEYIPRVIKAAIITLSDRASAGVYQDKSGNEIKCILDAYFSLNGWITEYYTRVIPDNRRLLKKEIKKAVDGKTHIIFTTGGTGIGSRDITPEVIRPMLTKEIPGIMENIRIKFGNQFPAALLSRSIAGVIGKTLVYVLPGSPKGAREYTEEIVKTIEHSLLMVNNIDKHG